ncbi:biotin carboxyl carrier protein [Pseudomonas sp. PvP001]
MDHADFTGPERFAVHTRWIETDFAESLTLAPRVEPKAEADILRTFVEIDGKRHALGLPAALLRGMSLDAAPAAQAQASPVAEVDAQALLTPVAGNLHTWVVEDGADVSSGQVVAVVEAMKMETSVLAPCAGRVQIGQQAGEYFEAGALIGRIQTDD